MYAGKVTAMCLFALHSWQHALSTLLVLPHVHRGISPVATTNPTWHPGAGAIWSRPRLAIGPAVGTRRARALLFNERI